MRVISFYLFLFIIIFSCKKSNNTVKISGNIRNSNIKKMYLTDGYQWKVFLDSCNIVNHEFKFTRKEIDYKTYSIYYKDSLGNQRSIEFINRVLSPDSIKYLTNYFMIDTSDIRIYGDWEIKKNHYYDVIAGSENKALFRTQMMQFGYLDADVNKRTNQLNEYLSIIKQYPNSNYLLTQINANKSVLKKTELEAMLKLFSPSALSQNATGRYLTTYLAKKKDAQTFENLMLADKAAKQSNLYDTTAKLNMVIVWASWCGPCRQEIPFLKEINKQYANKGLSMTSVSIDDDNNSWLKALEVENMNWKQLIVPTSKKDAFNTAFEIGSIPCVLFLNGKGKLISRTIGVDANSLEEYKKIINQQLK